MYDAMSRCFEFSSAFTIEHRSFGNDFLSFTRHRMHKKRMRFRTYLYTIRVYITLGTFFISTHTRFLSIVYFVHIIIIILRYERHLDFYTGICEFLIRLTCFLIAFPCISHAFTRTVAIAIDSRKIESNSGRGEIFETRVIIVI